MRRGAISTLAVSAFVAALSGCSQSPRDERPRWRDEAEAACLSQKLVRPSAYAEALPEISGPGICGMVRPFRLSAFAGGQVGLTSKVVLGCPVVSVIDRWLVEVVQPAAMGVFGVAVSDLRAGSYSCRSVNNQRGGKLSEHAFGNAVDVMAFRFADGRDLTVAKGWRGTPEEQDFLREVFTNSCRYFTTVLGPGADPFHYDHFHLDLARHDPLGRRHICKPIIKYTPRMTQPTPSPGPTPRYDGPEEPGEERAVDPDDAPIARARSVAQPAYASAGTPNRSNVPAPESVATRRPPPTASAQSGPLPSSRGWIAGPSPIIAARQQASAPLALTGTATPAGPLARPEPRPASPRELSPAFPDLARAPARVVRPPTGPRPAPAESFDADDDPFAVAAPTSSLGAKRR